jgi:hypothetical protein
MRISLALAAVAAGSIVAAAAPTVARAQPYAPDPAPPPGVNSSYLDHAIVAVYPVENRLVEVLIHDLGRAKAPAPMAITRVDGSVTRCGVPVEVFLRGRVARFRVPAEPRIVRVELDPDHQYPDAFRSNDVWTAQQEQVRQERSAAARNPGR